MSVHRRNKINGEQRRTVLEMGLLSTRHKNQKMVETVTSMFVFSHWLLGISQCPFALKRPMSCAEESHFIADRSVFSNNKVNKSPKKTHRPWSTSPSSSAVNYEIFFVVFSAATHCLSLLCVRVHACVWCVCVRLVPLIWLESRNQDNCYQAWAPP